MHHVAMRACVERDLAVGQQAAVKIDRDAVKIPEGRHRVTENRRRPVRAFPETIIGLSDYGVALIGASTPPVLSGDTISGSPAGRKMRLA